MPVTQKYYYDEPAVDLDWQEELYYEPAEPPAAYKPGPKPRTRRGMPPIIAIFLVVTVFVLALGGIGSKVINTTFIKGAQINQLEADLNDLQMENDLLRIEVDRLSAVARIEQAALAMGMERPTSKMYVASNLIQSVESIEEKAPPLSERAQFTPAPEAPGTLERILNAVTSFFAYAQG